MTKLFKTVALFAIAAMAVLSLNACSGKAQTSSTGSSASVTTRTSK